MFIRNFDSVGLECYVLIGDINSSDVSLTEEEKELLNKCICMPLEKELNYFENLIFKEIKENNFDSLDKIGYYLYICESCGVSLTPLDELCDCLTNLSRKEMCLLMYKIGKNKLFPNNHRFLEENYYNNKITEHNLSNLKLATYINSFYFIRKYSNVKKIFY